MKTWIQKFLPAMSIDSFLLFGVFFLGASLIALSNFSVLPLNTGDFFFFSFVFFLVALSRPGWVFALLVGTLPLESINIAPVSFGFDFRPYQFLALILGFSVLVRVIFRKTSWRLFRVSFFDGFVLLFGFSGAVSVFFLSDSTWFSSTLRQEIIVLSFVGIYFLGRIFLKSIEDLRIAGRFFFSAVILVLLYSLWQGIRMRFNLPAFEVMDGRPNGTFPEADWLGGFVAFVIAFLVPLSIAEFFSSGKVQHLRLVAHFLLLKLAFLVLLLSVSRSAWIAALVGVFFSVSLFAYRSKVFSMDRELWKKLFFGKVFVASAFLLSFFVVLVFELSSFDLFDRGGSVGSGLQKITVSCEEERQFSSSQTVDSQILSLSGCRHIDLEAIESERVAGRFVTEAYRSDPNISIRKEIYAQTYALLSERPFFGVGWGNSSRYLGNDERGAGLNSSNMFLEAWLGAGLLGILSFFVLWFSFAGMIVRSSGNIGTSSMLPLSVQCGFFGAWGAMTVFNLFNSGLLLSSLWVFLSCSWFFLWKKNDI